MIKKKVDRTGMCVGIDEDELFCITILCIGIIKTHHDFIRGLIHDKWKSLLIKLSYTNDNTKKFPICLLFPET